jgi:predicted RNase H-like HicB family nuclease
MAEKVKRYRVVYERDETGWWTARIPTVPGCHTQGKTIDTARRRIREALSLFVEHANRAVLVDDIRLPPGAQDAVRRYVALRKRVEEEMERAASEGRHVVTMLRRKPLKISGRDAASLLGVSHQRVHQLAHVATRKHRRRA